MADNTVGGVADSTATLVNGQHECPLQRLAEFVSDEWHKLKELFHHDDEEKEADGSNEGPGKAIGGDKSRNIDGELDSVANHMYSNEYFADTDSSNNGRIRAVKDTSGHDVRRFKYDSNGNLNEVVLPNGSYVVNSQGKWQFKDLYNNLSPTAMEWLMVDSHGNISFDNPSIGARVTLTPDEHTAISFWHRSDWNTRANWAQVEKDGSLISRVTDFGGTALREFNYQKGALVGIKNIDGTSWATEDGGKTWVFTEASGKATPYPELDLKVDQKGNVGYTVGGRKVVELANGVSMISPPSDWQKRWIPDYAYTQNFHMPAMEPAAYPI
jgi:YD repeat-containing protein